MDFKDLQTYTQELKSAFSKRDAMDDDMEEMYLLNWAEEDDVKRRAEGVRITKSPEARNKLNGAIRLLTATDPQFSVPQQANKGLAESQADELEHAAKVLWNAAGRVRGDPVHYDVVRSCLIFGEYYISVTDTAALVAFGKGQAPAIKKRYEEIAKRVPYLFEVHDPRTCYPERDQLGMRAIYREQEMSARECQAQFGNEVQGRLSRLKGYSTVTLCDYYDLERRIVWINGDSSAFIDEVHNLPFIPFVHNTVEGGRLFKDPEYQAQPFLYGAWKSGIWNRQNMVLTALYTMVYAMGLNPIFVEEQGPSGGEVVIDFSTPGGKIIVPYGSKFYPMINKGVIDPSALQALEIANNLMDNSTIYDQAMGEPVGKNAAFSMVALLHQAGRLPLLVSQRKAGWGIADTVRMAMLWQREKKSKFSVRYGENQAELDYEMIPEDYEIEARLDVELPQDKLQMAAVASQLAASGLTSFRWIRENVLAIGQSGEMDQEIWSEQAAKAMFGQMLQAMMQAPPQGPQQMGGAPGQQMQPPPGMEGGAPGQPPPMQPGMEPGMEQAMGGEMMPPGPPQPTPFRGIQNQRIPMRGGNGRP